MSFVELIAVRCNQDGCDAELTKSEGMLCYEVTKSGIALFSNHSDAIRAGESAGWILTDFGDTCAECVKKSQIGTVKDVLDAFEPMPVDLMVRGVDAFGDEVVEVYKDVRFKGSVEIKPTLEDVRKAWLDDAIELRKVYKWGAWRWYLTAPIESDHGAAFYVRAKELRNSPEEVLAAFSRIPKPNPGVTVKIEPTPHIRFVANSKGICVCCERPSDTTIIDTSSTPAHLSCPACCFDKQSGESEIVTPSGFIEGDKDA